jgi:FkbH-like protein
VTTDTATSPFRFAIAATFTAEPLRPVLQFWATQLNAAFDVRFAPYNQIAQTLLDPGSVIVTNSHGVNVILARLEDLGPADDPPRVESHLRELLDHIRQAAGQLKVPLIFLLCPSARAVAVDVEPLLREVHIPGVHFVHHTLIERSYPVDTIHDPEGERLGKIPYTDLYYSALGTMIVRYAHSLFLPPFKVVALDCDNTLWSGICGEDGCEGVAVDPPRRALQEFMLEQRSAGMLLTMASKNNEQDVLDTFAAHPEMPLQLRDFAAWRLNWSSKAENLVSLADELDLGIDSFIFVDDNPKECAEVSGALPEVLTLALPEPIERTPEFLRHVWAFDRPIVTDEDRRRSAYYSQQQEFGAEIRRASSLEDFMAQLNLRVNIQPLAESKIPRAAQLTQRTNQFNLTTIRRTESDIQSLAEAGYEVYTAEVSDRFGEYGLTGMIIAKPKPDCLEVDTFLLSCRVLGRGVEHRVAAFLGQTALARGLECVVFPYERTKKNAPARVFLDSVPGAVKVDETDAGFRLRVPAADLAGLRWSAPERVVSDKHGTPTSHASSAPRRAVDYACIANQLSSAAAILAAMRQSRTSYAPEESLTETEARLARIWSELLERASVVATDNFFDLGGHSLLAVLLLLRIREAFGVELSIDDVYSGTLTLSDLAARIETLQLGGIDPEEYAALLAEIEGLSDEEARQLLAAEDSGNA